MVYMNTQEKWTKVIIGGRNARARRQMDEKCERTEDESLDVLCHGNECDRQLFTKIILHGFSGYITHFRIEGDTGQG